MMNTPHPSRSFGAVAAVYESGRPDYPVEAVEWMLEPARRIDRRVRVADVGAGTGKLTRVIARLGAEVVAVDPDPRMLDTLRARVPGVPTRTATAERLPFEDGAFDAVLLAQAWHWVDPVDASAEIARVLRPGGVLGLVWNVRDEDVEWVRRLSEIMARGGGAAEAEEPSVRAPFTASEERTWRWADPKTRETLFAMARSRSYFVTADPETQKRIEGALAVLFDETGAVGERTVELPYVTRAYRFARP